MFELQRRWMEFVTGIAKGSQMLLKQATPTSCSMLWAALLNHHFTLEWLHNMHSPSGNVRNVHVMWQPCSACSTISFPQLSAFNKHLIQLENFASSCRVSCPGFCKVSRANFEWCWINAFELNWKYYGSLSLNLAGQSQSCRSDGGLYCFSSLKRHNFFATCQSWHREMTVRIKCGNFKHIKNC